MFHPAFETFVFRALGGASPPTTFPEGTAQMALANSWIIDGRFHTLRFYMASMTVYLLGLKCTDHHFKPPGKLRMTWQPDFLLVVYWCTLTPSPDPPSGLSSMATCSLFSST